MTVDPALLAKPTIHVVVSQTNQPFTIHGTLAVSAYASTNRVAAASAVDVAMSSVTVRDAVLAFTTNVRTMLVCADAGLTRSAADAVKAVVALSCVGVYVAIVYPFQLF
jgi:hypothetical protein